MEINDPAEFGSQGEFVGALLLESVQTRLDQIFEYNPTLAESEAAMAGRRKE